MKKFCCLTFLLIFPFLTALHAFPFSPEISENSLLKYAHSVYSENGEEGIIDAILEKIGVFSGFLVECGGNEGTTGCNTRLLVERDWRGVYIEPDSVRFQKMAQNCAPYPKIQCLKERVTPFDDDPAGKTMDALAERYFPDVEIDVMSIAVGGSEPLILKNMKLKPKLIVIEGGMFWHPMMQLEVPVEVAAQKVQQPICVMTQIAKANGYELICSSFNAFFIRKDLYPLFAEINNNPSLIWWEALVHIKKIRPDFFDEVLRIRRASWIQEWERKDPNITFLIH